MHSAYAILAIHPFLIYLLSQALGFPLLPSPPRLSLTLHSAGDSFSTYCLPSFSIWAPCPAVGLLHVWPLFPGSLFKVPMLRSGMGARSGQGSAHIGTKSGQDRVSNMGPSQHAHSSAASASPAGAPAAAPAAAAPAPPASAPPAAPGSAPLAAVAFPPAVPLPRRCCPSRCTPSQSMTSSLYRLASVVIEAARQGGQQGGMG